ncbi:hypothetical protein HK096_010590 [Nowakowskiella sp. JEL0078]|nr:hypothetical protein HK096_010590 [Nowakowskiella sp. JEL0078]
MRTAVVFFTLSLSFVCTFAQSANLTECLQTPTLSTCSSLQYPDSYAVSDRQLLCKGMPYMLGCSIATSCGSDTTSQFCQPFSLLADICSQDMPTMSGCRNYTQLCASGSVIKECSTSPPLTNLPKTSVIAAHVYSICGSMYMDGCSSCTFSSATALPNCDILGTYVKLCVAMPDMTECSNLKSICTANPKISYCSDYSAVSSNTSSSNSGSISSTTDTVSMLMYFHNRPAYVLFNSWVPKTTGEFAWTFFVLVAVGIVYELFSVARVYVEQKHLLSNKGVFKSVTNESSEGLSKKPFVLNKVSSTHVFLWTTLATVIRFVEILLHYLLMLAAMSFNITVFFAIITGLALGYPLSLHLKQRFVGVSDLSPAHC